MTESLLRSDASLDEGEAPAPARPSPWPRLIRTYGAVVLLAAVAFSLALTVHEKVFPFFTGDDDDTVYVFEAKTLLDGHLTLPAAEQEKFFRPWLSGTHGDRITFPFQHGWPAALAASELLFGSMRIALGLTAAGLVIVVFLFAREIVGDRSVAITAAALFLASPFFVIHSGTFLNYLFTLLLELTFGWLLLRGLRTGARPSLVLAGLALGWALLSRPFDALLFSLPFCVYGVATHRRDLRRLLRPALWTFAGFVGPLILVLAVNRHLTGSPFRFPEANNGGIQTFGFGHKRLAEGTHLVNYKFRKAVGSLHINVNALPSWYFGGLVATALALYGLLRGRLRAKAGLLVGIAVVFPLGYFFWWGNYLSVAARRSIGPHYYIPVVVPVAILAAGALVRLFRWRVLAGVGVIAVMLVQTGVAFPSKYRAARATPRLFDREHRVFARTQLTNAVVFLPRASDQEPYVLHPIPFLSNRPDLSGPVLYASEHGAENFELLTRYPRRTPYRFSWAVPQGGDILRPIPYLTRLRPVSGQELVVRLRFRNPDANAPFVTAYVMDGGKVVGRTVLDEHSAHGSTYQVNWRISRRGIETADANGAALATSARRLHRRGELTVGVSFYGRPTIDGDRVEHRVPYQITPRVQLLLPGEQWHRFVAPKRFWLAERGNAVVEPLDVTPARG